MTTAPDISALTRETDGLIAALSLAAKTIANELSVPFPRNDARVISAMHAIDADIHKVRALQPKLNLAESRLAERARAENDDSGRPPRLPQGWYQLRARSDKLRNDVNQWHETQALVRRQTPPQAEPLYPTPDSLPPPLASQLQISDAMFDALHRLMTPAGQGDEAEAHGCFPDISLANSLFISHAHAAYRLCRARQAHAPLRFLDVGCGMGLKLLPAADYFDQIAGIEFDPQYARVARAFLDRVGLKTAEALHADALTFEGYAEFDVIYFYRPMRSNEDMVRLERQILSQAAPGTILIAPYQGFGIRHADLGCARLGDHLFVAGMDQAEADRLENSAERIGLDVTRRKTDLPSIWEPVIAASFRNGFGIRRHTPPVV